MPYHTVSKHSGCPSSKPVAVVKDSDGKVMGCHASKEKANKQMAALYVAEEKRIMTKVQEIWEKVRAIFEPELEQEVEMPESAKIVSRTTIQRQDDGRYRAFSISAVSALNRSGEIDSRALFDSMISIAKATERYPQRDFMHLGHMSEHFIVGDVDYMARDGNVLVTSTLYRDNELARAEIAARQSNPGDWGDSIAYVLLDDPEFERTEEGTVPVLNMGFCKFVSTVPERLAASRFTSGTVQEVGRMALAERDLEALVDLMQGDKEQAVAFLSQIPGIENTIEESGMLTRTVEEGEPDVQVEPEPVEQSTTASPDVQAAPEPESEVERLFELEAVETEVVLNDEVLESIVVRMDATLQEKFDAITERIDALNTAIQNVSTSAQGANEDVQRRLEGLEKDEEMKKAEWAADLPPKQMIRVTDRPRQRAEISPETMADKAERNLDTWGEYPA